MDVTRQIDFQQRYYAQTAASYDDTHVGDDEHEVALRMLFAWLPILEAHTILDVGAGTGRLQRRAKALGVPAEIVGVEPVAALRRQGHERGIPPSQLVEGDATALQWPDRSFDVVSSFGVLHHVADPRKAVQEMCRVAGSCVFISDSNNLGQGSLPLRFLKRAIWRLGLWPAADYLKTRGKGFTISEGDGLAYSYSVFDSIPILKQRFAKIYLFSTQPVGSGDLLGTGHLAVLAKD